MSSRRKRLLLSHGYISVGDVEEAMARVVARVEAVDEHLALEYLLDPAQAPLEEKIERLCKRLARVLGKLIDDELQARRRLIDEAPAPGQY